MSGFEDCDDSELHVAHFAIRLPKITECLECQLCALCTLAFLPRLRYCIIVGPDTVLARKSLQYESNSTRYQGTTVLAI